MAIVSSLLSVNIQRMWSFHSNIISSNPSFKLPGPPSMFHIFLLCQSYTILVCHTNIYVHVAPRPPDKWSKYICLSYHVGLGPLNKTAVSDFAQSIGPCRYLFIAISSLNPPYISRLFSPFDKLFNARLSVSLRINFLLLSWTRQTYPYTVHLIGLPLNYSVFLDYGIPSYCRSILSHPTVRLQYHQISP